MSTQTQSGIVSKRPDITEITLEDIAPPCEIRKRPSFELCDKTAQWVAIGRCCGVVATICDQHRQTTVDKAANTWFRCSRCHTDLGIGLPWLSCERI